MKELLLAAFLLNTAGAEQLRITVYDRADVPANGIVNELRRIFHQSGIDIIWETGIASAEEASTMLYNGTPQRGHEQEALCSARRDIALSILRDSPPGLSKSVLGMSQPLAPSGLNVRIFDNHVREAAQSRNREHSTVLAHAIAHEIGHVLLRSGDHMAHGLMADVWTEREYNWLERGALFFTGGQSNSMRAMLAGTGCPASGSIRDSGIATNR